MTRSPRYRLRFWSIPLVVLALAWTIRLLWDASPQLITDLPRMRARWLWLTLAGTALAGYLGFEAFRVLFIRLCPDLYGRLALAHLYFTGQVMKHVPGRVWGIAYQAAIGHRASFAQWASVSIVYMVLTTSIALWVTVTVISYFYGIGWCVLAFLVGVGAYFGVWHPRLINALLTFVRRIPLSAVARMAGALQPFANVDTQFKLRVLLWFGVSWFAYLVAWGSFGLAWPGLTFADGVVLCGLYTAAWFVGYISLVSPSGIGVRELVFVLLAQRFPPDAVAVMAVLGRAVLLTVDILWGALFLAARPAPAPQDLAATAKH